MLNSKTKIAHFTNPLYLESGRILEPYDIIYETYGTLNKDKTNVVVVFHALTGSHHSAGVYENENKAGWWDKIIGSNKAIDTDRFFVITSYVLGSCFGSTGPMSYMYPQTKEYRYKFPVLSIKDMVKAQKILFASLGIHSVYALIGASMGGMQALQFAVEYPDFSKKIFALATTYATRPWTIAFNKVTQEAIVKDPNFKNGQYQSNAFKENGLTGLAIGRMAGHISFLAHDSMDRKFGREYASNDGLFELFGKFQVERYLEYNSYNFSKNFDPLSYLYIIKAINIYDISRGYESLEEALEKIDAQMHLIGFKKDILFLPEELKEVHNILKIKNKDSYFLEIDSDYGHDSFLVETEKFDTYIKENLEKN